jgi:hypothetical protein
MKRVVLLVAALFADAAAAAPPFSYLGCYTDDASRALPILLLNSGATVESCVAAAQAQGLTFAGLQYFGQCFGGNNLGPTYTKAPGSECNTPCSANSGEICGGAWRNSIYSQQYAAVTFYFVAHQDDWQLFMNRNAYADMQNPAVKVVFVYMTAGDAGNDQSYYLAREEGAKEAVRFAVDTTLGPDVGASSGLHSTASINGHSITVYKYKNTVSYFLRLPDGNGDGGGFAATGYVSLQKFWNRTIPTLNPIDGSTLYSTGDDLLWTMYSIAHSEAAGAQWAWINMPDPITSNNPNDHSDHVHTGWLTETVAANLLSCMNVAYYVDYDVANRNRNVPDDELLNQVGVFAVTVHGRTEAGHGSTWDQGHKNWLGRSYFRTRAGYGSACF